MRRTEFWERMEASFGPVYASSVATDQVLPDLDGKTVVEALTAGEDVRVVWRAVCATFEIAPALR